MNPAPRRTSRAALAALLVAIAVTVTAFGVAAGVSTQIARGSSETGQGAFVSQHPLTYWTWVSTQLGTIPAVVPRLVSTTVTAPTVLNRGGRSFTINPGVAGQPSVAWSFQQAVTAPVSTELKITFVDGLAGPVSTIVAYVETNARALGAPATFVFYWDAGAFAPTSLSIETMNATVLACTAVGTCP